MEECASREMEVSCVSFSTYWEFRASLQQQQNGLKEQIQKQLHVIQTLEAQMQVESVSRLPCSTCTVAGVTTERDSTETAATEERC